MMQKKFIFADEEMALLKKNFTTEAQSAQRKKKVRFGDVFLRELPLFSP